MVEDAGRFKVKSSGSCSCSSWVTVSSVMLLNVQVSFFGGLLFSVDCWLSEFFMDAICCGGG